MIYVYTPAMDISRPEVRRRNNTRRIIIGIFIVALVIAVSIVLAQLEPAAPSVARASVWVDTVRQGEMLRQVRGPGVLAPTEIRWRRQAGLNASWFGQERRWSRAR